MNKFTVEDIELAIETRTPIKSMSGRIYFPNRLVNGVIYCTPIDSDDFTYQNEIT